MKQPLSNFLFFVVWGGAPERHKSKSESLIKTASLTRCESLKRTMFFCFFGSSSDCLNIEQRLKGINVLNYGSKCDFKALALSRVRPRIGVYSPVTSTHSCGCRVCQVYFINYCSEISSPLATPAPCFPEKRLTLP